MATIPARIDYVQMISYDALGNKYETNLNKNFGTTSIETYEYINTIARALNALTSNTYNDSLVVMTKSVNEALIEQSAEG